MIPTNNCNKFYKSFLKLSHVITKYIVYFIYVCGSKPLLYSMNT